MSKLLSAASFLVLSSASVLAADLPMSYKSPAPVAPLYTWTGFYIGVNGGGGAMNDSNTSGSSSSSQSATNLSGTNLFGVSPSNLGGNNAFHGTGGLAGGQVGYNYQITNVVFGIEGEGYWSGMKGTLDSSQNLYSGSTLSETFFTHNQTENK